MTIELIPWDDRAAFEVFYDLDPNDQIEAELALGEALSPYALFANWRGINGHRVVSLVARVQRVGASIPFAVVGISRCGWAGVGDAALLACNHTRYRRQLAELGLRIRRDIPNICRDAGLHRLEARSWLDHPTAGGFLTACGFHHEVTSSGFGASGRIKFQQFAWLAQSKKE